MSLCIYGWIIEGPTGYGGPMYQWAHGSEPLFAKTVAYLVKRHSNDYKKTHKEAQMISERPQTSN